MTGLKRPIAPGMRVTVRSTHPEAHCRTPAYLRGKHGIVEQEVGRFRDPSKLAFHQPGLPMRRLLRVRFRQIDLWPEYGPPGDTLYADLYDHWLEPPATVDDAMGNPSDA